MGKRVLLYIIAVIVIAGGVWAESPKDTADIVGAVDYKIQNDTMYVKYKISPQNIEPDSIYLSIGNKIILLNDSIRIKGDIIIYDKFTPTLSPYKAFTVYRKKGKIHCEGEFKIPIDGESTENWGGFVEVIYIDNFSQRQRSPRYFQLSSYWVGMGQEFFAPSFGYYESNMAEPLRKHGLFFGYGLSFQFNTLKTQYELSSSWTGFTKSYKFSEPVRLGLTYYTGTRNNFMPQLLLGGKLSMLQVREYETEFRNVEWGGDIGIAFESAYEKVSYQYSTAQGGYHTFSLSLTLESSGDSKIGTKYQFVKNHDIWMVKVGMYLDGFGFDMFEGGKNLNRHNNRTIVHKAFAAAFALPMLPFYAFAHMAKKSD